MLLLGILLEIKQARAK